EYVFQSDISELRQLKSKNNTVKSIVMIIAAMFFLVFVSNCLNVNRADSILRRNEFEIMRTLGMSRKQEKKIHFYENFIAAGLSTIIGCIVGVIVGWAFTFVIFAGETSIRVNEAIDWRSILITVIAMILFVMVTTFFAPKTEKI
ncbi:MAG: FtsX-like permease family protein, partial [Wujia sp.]